MFGARAGLRRGVPDRIDRNHQLSQRRAFVADVHVACPPKPPPIANDKSSFQRLPTESTPARALLIAMGTQHSRDACAPWRKADYRDSDRVYDAETYAG